MTWGRSFARSLLAAQEGLYAEAAACRGQLVGTLRLGVVPLTLFSGAFFPVANLGAVLEWLARLTPLWHGVNLSRMLCLDTVDWPVAAVNAGVLLALTVAGWWFAITGLQKRLGNL